MGASGRLQGWFSHDMDSDSSILVSSRGYTKIDLSIEFQWGSFVATFIRSHIICRYGVLRELISDRGVHFRGEVDALLQRYGIQHHRSSAYKP